ncbi:MAG: PilW family protein [Bdellovibrio sp.]
MKNNSRGYTIIELMLAMGLATLVIAGTLNIIYYFFSEKTNLDSWSSTQIDMSFALKDLENDLRNVVRMDPTEDLFTSGDGDYLGLSSISAGNEPKICLNDSNYSVLRYTTLDRFLRSERLLRSWSEKNDAGKNSPANELRITADATSNSLFSADRKPAEIVVVDADRRYIRRYEVSSAEMHLNSPLDPYDDTPKKDANGNPITFNYVSVFLKIPKNAKGTPIDKTASVFITGSEIYASTTNIVCIRTSDKSLVKADLLQDKTTVSFQSNSKEFNVESFTAKYLGTKKGIRVDPVNFFTDMVADPQGTCVNTVFLELKASLLVKSSSQTNTKSTAKNIVGRARTIFATNLNSKRALSCIQ